MSSKILPLAVIENCPFNAALRQLKDQYSCEEIFSDTNGNNPIDRG